MAATARKPIAQKGKTVSTLTALDDPGFFRMEP
jgi:hypothetical protein